MLPPPWARTGKRDRQCTTRQPATSDAKDLPLALPFEGRLGAGVDETADALGVEKDTIYRMILDGRLIASKVGRRTIVHVSSIRSFLAASRIAPRPRVRRIAPATPKPPPAKPARRKPHHRQHLQPVQAAQTASAAP